MVFINKFFYVRIPDSRFKDIAYADKLSDANITKWFQLSEAKAREQQAEYSKLVILDNSQSFTLED